MQRRVGRGIGLHVRHFWRYARAIEWWAHHLSIVAYVAATGLGIGLLMMFVTAAFE